MKLNFIKNFLLLIIGSLLLSTTAYGEEIIELEYGNEADPEYATYNLSGGETYISDDEDVVIISGEGLLTAVNYGETTIHVLVNNKITESYLVIVYLVENEETPFGNALVLQPFLTGYPNETFKPDQNVSVAEASVMIARALNINVIVYQPINVEAGHWAYEGLQCLLSHQLNLVEVSSSKLEETITKFQLKSTIEKYADQNNFMLNQETMMALSNNDLLTRGELVYYISSLFNQETSGFIPPRFKDVKVDHEYYYYINQNIQ